MATFEQEKKDLGAKASSFGDTAKEVAADVGSKAKDVASTVAQKVGDAASLVSKKAEDAASSIGSGMQSLGGTVRAHTPEGPIGVATGAVADTLETGGRYLQEHGLKGVGKDLATLIRRNPIPAVLIGIGFGFLVAHATKRT